MKLQNTHSKYEYLSGERMTHPLNTVLQGDCLTILPTLCAQSVDFILTDPPYLVNYQSRDGRSVPNDNNDAWLRPAFAEMYRVLKEDSFAVSFYGWPSADKFLQAYRAAGFKVVGHLMFPKRYVSATGYVKYQHESAHLLVKGTPWSMAETISDVVEWSYTGNHLHPTQKPVETLKKLIGVFCPPCGIVLDPFAGSGSTLAAAEKLGRQWHGIELDPTYHRIACERLMPSSYGGEALLGSAKVSPPAQRL
jgi:adenine-specific DNA-methyltransferase